MVEPRAALFIREQNSDAHNVKVVPAQSWGKTYSYIARELSYLITIRFNKHGGSYCWIRKASA